MISVKRFDSFTEVKDVWQTLEKQTVHYPFQAFWYQELFTQQFCKQEDVYLLGIFEDDTLLSVGGFEKVDTIVLFLGMKQVLGGQDLTDYGDLLYNPSVSDEQLQDIWQAIVSYFFKEGGKTIQLDFIREDSKSYRMFHATKKGNITPQEVSPYLVVSSSWDEYLQKLSRKKRHELTRKIRRFEDEDAFHFCSDATIHNDFEDFIRLHRVSDTAKEKFMSDDMKQFFWDIVSAKKDDYRIDFCFLEIGHKRVASIMSFVGQNSALLYNSGFDPEYGHFSAGLMLHAYLVKKSIEEGLQIHDFLRGNERYKYDLGGQDMQLYKITIPLR